MSRAILANFGKLIEADPELLGAGQALVIEGMAVQGGRCLFELAALFRWVNAGESMDYPRFRSLLYSGKINTALQQIGYIIEVHDPSGHVDNSIYRLRRL